MSTCLGLIVKNEAHVIDRCIRNAAPYVDDVFILDTGSTDDTAEVIARTCEELGLPVKLAEIEWQDFGHARTEMMRQAREFSQSEWMIQLDADWVLEGAPDAWDYIEKNPHDAYGLTISDSGQEWPLPKITRLAHPWRYEAPVHEYLTDDGQGGTVHRLGVPGLKAVHHNDGGSRVGRHHRDVEVLRGREDPRSQFYFAQSLFSTRQYAESRDAYEVRAKNTEGWVEETYFSLYRIAVCSRLLGERDRAVREALTAWDYRPTRLEALCVAIELCRELQQWNLALLLGRKAVEIARKREAITDDALFLETWRWDWGAEWEALTAEATVGDKKLALYRWRDMMDSGDMPEQYVAATTHNINWLEGLGA